MKKKIFALFFSIFILSQLSAGIMEKPRKVYAFSTEFFDILFPEESLSTAEILAENADQLYRQAVSKLDEVHLKSKGNKRFPVIISPDSDYFSVTYTPLPYNRILIYEAVPVLDDSNFTDFLLSNFYGELIRAVYQSYKGPVETKLSKIITADAFQPVYLENMPFSFLEGIQILSEGENSQGKLNDGYFLQILSQAKLENKFPSFIQTLGSRDVYPGSEIIQAAGTAFCAFILQKYGIEKFTQMWKESGKFSAHLTEGIFLDVYGISVTELWKNFEAAVPLPADLENLFNLENESSLLFQYENKGLYKNLLNSSYGLVWYDDLRHEVSLYNQDSLFKGRQLLFLADNVTNLSVSPDGRFLAASFFEKNDRNDLQKNKVWIYDLKTRLLVKENYRLRDAFVTILPDGSCGVAGIADNKTYASIQIYYSEKLSQLLNGEKNQETQLKTRLIYEKKFEANSIPFTPVSVSSDKIYAILNSKNTFYLYSWNFKDDIESYYELPQKIKIRNLRLNQNPYKTRNFSSSILTFEYVNTTNLQLETLQTNNFQAETKKSEASEINFTRFGFSFLNDNFEPEQTWFLANNLSGGVTYPVIKGNDLFYASKKYDHGEIRHINLQKLKFYNVDLSSAALTTTFENTTSKIDSKPSIKAFSDYEIKTYKQISDVFKGTIYPFAPVKEISVEDKAEKAAGLGVTFSALADKYSNNLIVLSAGLGFLDLTFEKYTNPTKRIQEEIEKEHLDKNRDQSAAFFYQNSAAPLDISVGTLYKSTSGGDYNLKSLLGTVWTVPIGMSFRKLNFNMEIDYNASTQFRDIIYSDLYPAKAGRTSIKNAYQDFELSYTIEYTNMHQSGFSPYEQRGLTAEISTNIIWDYNLPKLETTDKTELFRVKDFADCSFIKPSQINLGFSACAKLPELSPVKDYNNWILSFPTTVDFELFKNNGTALDVKTETLIFGREIQNGFNFLHFYFSRVGIKAGYDYSLIYDPNEVSSPDLRDFSRFYYAFVNTYIQDKFTISTELDFVPAIGILSSALMNFDFTFEYYIRSNSTKFSLDVDIKL